MAMVSTRRSGRVAERGGLGVAARENESCWYLHWFDHRLGGSVLVTALVSGLG